jgi:homoserine trans-succinylase
MAELIALSLESGSEEEMDALMLLYLISKRQKSVWKKSVYEKEKNSRRIHLTSEFSDKQFTNDFRLNRSQFSEVHRLVQYSIYSERCNAQKSIGTEEKLAVFFR